MTAADRMPLRLAWLVLICALPAFAQGLHLGMKAGFPMTQYFETGETADLHGSASYSAATRRYTLGASAEWRLAHFGFEIDSMYHRMGYVAIVNSIDSAGGAFRNSAIDIKGNSWDFPVMAKYRFGRGTGLYVAGGAAVRYVGPVRGRGQQTAGSPASGESTTTPLDTGEPSELRKRFYPGLTLAAGWEIRAGHFGLLPEFRYTRWTANISAPGGLLRFPSNQAEFLAGIVF